MGTSGRRHLARFTAQPGGAKGEFQRIDAQLRNWIRADGTTPYTPRGSPADTTFMSLTPVPGHTER